MDALMNKCYIKRATKFQSKAIFSLPQKIDNILKKKWIANILNLYFSQ